MDILNQLTYIFNYSLQCAALPVRTMGCRDFWFYSLVVFVSVGLIIIFLLIRSLLTERAEIAEYQKRKLARAAIADDDVMNKHKWQADSDFDDIDQIELANQMREQIRQRTKTNYNI